MTDYCLGYDMNFDQLYWYPVTPEARKWREEQNATMKEPYYRFTDDPKEHPIWDGAGEAPWREQAEATSQQRPGGEDR